MRIDGANNEFCRVCRCEGTDSRPLFYPCMCTGSIKYIHQDCLVQWLQYSKRRTCELCNHRFRFAPVYASGTPRVLPLGVLFAGLIRSLRRCILNWLHLCIVFLAWMVVVPLTACRIYRCLFTGSVSSLLSLPLSMLSTRHLVQDILQGFTIVILALAAFLGYISLREQLLQGGIPAWLEQAANIGNEGGVNGAPFFPDLFNLFVAPDGHGAAAVDEDGGHGGEMAGNPLAGRNRNSPSSDSSVDPTSFQAVLSGDSHQSGSFPASGDPSHVQPQDFDRGQERIAAGHPQVNDAPDVDGDGVAFGEAMNWNRMLGLDGSFAFLEHVLWIVALNTLFVTIFAFFPYHLGHFAALGFHFQNLISVTHMDGLATTLLGYVIIAIGLMLLHCIFRYWRMPRACYWFGLSYVYIKVALVCLLEVGIFPTLCGFWIDACTLSLFNATLTNRVSIFHYAPVTFTFVHWAVGMLYLFYMASLLNLTRSVVRPGVLRFVYHFNDPDYKPIQEMIMLPVHVYTQRLVAAFSIWGILIVFMLWIPIESFKRAVPGFLPFQITVAHENPLDYSVEIILVQVVLPFLLDVHAKATVRGLLRLWCTGVSSLLGIRSYLVGDVAFAPGDVIINEDGEGVRFCPPGRSTLVTDHSVSSTETLPPIVHHQQLAQIPTDSLGPDSTNESRGADGEPAVNDFPEERNEDAHSTNRYVPYKRPSHFPIRMIAFGFVVLFSLMLFSSTLLVVPVGVGRFTFTVLNAKTSPKHDAVAMVTGVTILGLLLRVATCLPMIFTGIRHLASSASGRITNLLYWPKRLSVLRVWTRLGTTCEISILHPALPPPRAPSRAATSNAEQFSLFPCLVQSTQIVFNLLQLVGVAFVFLVLLPVALGLLINLMFVTPFQVEPKKTLVIGFWEHWIFGIMHLKVAILLILAGPTWWLRRRLEAIQNELIQRRYRTRSYVLLSEMAPILVCVGLCLTAPYLLAHYLGHCLDLGPDYAFRYIYPIMFASFVVILLAIFQFGQLQQLYTRIKDERYLVGRKLVNFGSMSTVEPEGVMSPI